MTRLIHSALLLLLALPLAAEPADGVIRLSEPVEVTATHEVFGAPLGETGDVLSLPELLADSGKFTGREVVVRTEINQVCQKKGCFFVAQSGDDTVRVTFVDYSFFIPTDSAGKAAVVRGIFNTRRITEAQARHFAEDTGADPDQVAGGGLEYSIVATSVSIPVEHGVTAE